MQLVDVLELSDDSRENARMVTRLAARAAQSDARVLLTYRVPPDLARDLAAHLGLAHAPVPDRPTVRA